jgi:hypothetical protein
MEQQTPTTEPRRYRVRRNCLDCNKLFYSKNLKCSDCLSEPEPEENPQDNSNEEVFQPELEVDGEHMPEVVPAPAPQSENDVDAPPVKHGRGRPRKTADSSEEKRRHANQKRGLAFDERWLPGFRILCGQLPQREPYTEILYVIETLQRSISYGLKSIQSLDPNRVAEIQDSEWNLGYSLADGKKAVFNRTKSYFTLFADAGCTRIIELLGRENITNQELLDVITETFRKVLQWAEHNPEHFEWRFEIEEAVAKLMQGSNLYEPPAAPARPVGRPPRAPITAPEAVEGLTYFTGTSALDWRHTSDPQLDRPYNPVPEHRMTGADELEQKQKRAFEEALARMKRGESPF